VGGVQLVGEGEGLGQGRGRRHRLNHPQQRQGWRADRGPGHDRPLG
jgi:hypothetical protein